MGKLIIKFLPTYSPELNIIEILWRFIKYYWLPFSAYLSFEDLVREVENILVQIGTEFKIDFAYYRCSQMKRYFRKNHVL